MLSSLVLDALLVLILLMIVPIGFFRGGLREVCTAGGVLLGVLLADQWADRWGRWLAARLDVDEGAMRFAVAVAVVVLAGAVIGYGASAAFNYHPGPGGRLYGGYLALLIGMVLTGFLINAYVAAVFDGERPKIIQDAYVARALSVGFEWVLLAGAAGILLATVFGMLVREREEEPFVYGPAPLSHQTMPPASAPGRRLAAAPEPEKIEPPAAEEPQAPTAPVRIREVRHWEDRAEPQHREYGGGWHQTWPGAVPRTPSPARRPWEQPTARHRPPNSPPAKPSDASGSENKDILRQWMDQDRPESDE